MIGRARLSETALALVGTVVATWPLTTLLQGGSWLWSLIVLSLGVALLGAALRSLGTPATIILVVQLVALVFVVSVLNLSSHFDATFSQAARDLINEASTTIRESPAPAPVTPGLLMMLQLIVPGLAITVDFLAVTARQPALAGVPLLVIFLLSTSNTGRAMNPVYFVALAVIWLAMVAHGGSMLVRAWSSVRARSTTPSRLDDQLGLAGLASVARLLGVLTIVAALAVPMLLPSTSPRFFGQGLGQGSGGGTGSVGFSTTLNLANDLRSDNKTPVFKFTTDAIQPPPLRVSVGGTYSNGQWTDFPEASSAQVVGGSNNRVLPLPTGMSSGAVEDTQSMTITSNTMSSPNVPAPYPLASADFGDNRWAYAQDTLQPYTFRSVSSYTLSFREPKRDEAEGDSQIDRTYFRDQLRLDSSSRSRVEALAKRLGGSTPFAKAVAIQNYLRGDEFTYSLTLAATRTVDGRRLDPLSNFLVTKRGYCTQFATAMIMLARAEGIPARMALGFLPGSASGDNTYTVLQSNAHAWPELYIAGMGWTRFEPTPGVQSGTAPSYTTNDSDTATGGGRNPEASASTSSAPSSSAAAGSQAASSAPASSSAASTGSAGRPWGVIMLVVAVVLIGLLGALVLPLLARRRRDGILARLGTHRPVEAQWQVLQSQLSDLGIPPPSDRSPRAAEQYYRSATVLGTSGTEALHRAVQGLEDERYGAPGTAAPIDRDTERVLTAVREAQSLPARVGAAVVPRTGRQVVADALRTAARWPSTLVTRLSRRRRDS